jgi:hypothetical protein
VHFHLPRPLHGWREFAGEVGIIVVGVLIALTAEQAVEAFHWHEKVRVAERNVDFEINVQLDNAEETVALNRCAAPFFDALEGAILRHDHNAIQSVHDTGVSLTAGPAATGGGNGMELPYEARPWRSTAWQSTMSTQVADHIDPVLLAQYGFIYSGVENMRGIQSEMVRDYGEVMTGRLPAPTNPMLISLQLAAAERLRAEVFEARSYSRGMLAAAGGAVHPGWKSIDRVRAPHLGDAIERELRWCQNNVLSLRGKVRGA